MGDGPHDSKVDIDERRREHVTDPYRHRSLSCVRKPMLMPHVACAVSVPVLSARTPTYASAGAMGGAEVGGRCSG